MTTVNDGVVGAGLVLTPIRMVQRRHTRLHSTRAMNACRRAQGKESYGAGPQQVDSSCADSLFVPCNVRAGVKDQQPKATWRQGLQTGVLTRLQS